MSGDTRVVVAGTFGPLHDGHRNLLRTALQYGDGGVVIGLASDAFARGKRTRPVPDFEDRRTALERELNDLDEWDREIEIRQIESEQEIVVEDPTVDALVISPETVEELEGINDARRERGDEPLDGIVAPYVLAEDGERISSTRIVRGEIDEHGHLQ